MQWVESTGQTSPQQRFVLPQNVSGAETENLALKDCLAVARRVGFQAQHTRGRGAVVVSKVLHNASTRAVRWGREGVGITVLSDQLMQPVGRVVGAWISALDGVRCCPSLLFCLDLEMNSALDTVSIF